MPATTHPQPAYPMHNRHVLSTYTTAVCTQRTTLMLACLRAAKCDSAMVRLSTLPRPFATLQFNFRK